MLLSLLIWTPLVFAVIVLMARSIKAVKVVTLASTVVSMLLALAVMAGALGSTQTLTSETQEGGSIHATYAAEVQRLALSGDADTARSATEANDLKAAVLAQAQSALDAATAQAQSAQASEPDQAALVAAQKAYQDRAKEANDEFFGVPLKGDQAAYARSLQRDIQLMRENQGLGQQLTYVEFAPWIKSFNVNYFVGVDGLSMVLILLTNFLFLVCLGACWGMDKMLENGKPRYSGMKGFYVLYLILQCSLIGVFAAQDLMLFYVFWEIVLLPMYFLIGIWGGPKRIYAAIKFFIYTLVGSVLMLIAFLYFYLNTGGDGIQGTFNVVSLMQLLPEHFAIAKGAGTLCFLALFIGFAIKVPVVPFHTWLPDAHVEAPTAVSMLLAGILLKMGGYGFFRFLYPFMPEQAYDFSTMMVILGAGSIVYGAYCAMGQTDFKRIVAYSSVSHMGYILLGLGAGTKLAMAGAAQQMVAHGISSAMMFGIVGVIYDRAHHRDVNRFGGIGLQMPYFSGMAIIAFFASLGLPLLCGFFPEMWTFFGAFRSPIGEVNGEWWLVFTSVKMWTVIATSGIVLTAVYLLWTYQRVYMGEVKNPLYKKFRDLLPREWAMLLPLGAAAIALGVLPQITSDPMDGTVDAVKMQMTKWSEGYQKDIDGDDVAALDFSAMTAIPTTAPMAAAR